MVNKTFVTSQFVKGLKELRKNHKDRTIDKLQETVRKLENFEILNHEQHEHGLTNNKNLYRDIHIEGNVILLYRYDADIIFISLVLGNLVNHENLNRKENLKENISGEYNPPIDIKKL